jgi:hypothetical protein
VPMFLVRFIRKLKIYPIEIITGITIQWIMHKIEADIPRKSAEREEKSLIFCNIVANIGLILKHRN